MSYVKPSDFEDMMRPLARAAMNQGWHLKLTANGHVKWIPPKGPPIITSITNAAYKPNVQKLRAGGLIMPNDIVEKENGDGPPIQHTSEVTPPPPSDPGPTPKEKKRMLPRGTVQTAVLNFFQSQQTPGMTYNLDDVVSHVRGRLPTVSREVISTTCSQNAAAGKLVRMGKGMYRYAQQDRRAADGNGTLTPEEQHMLQEDEAVFDRFMNALSELQDWATKMRKMSVQFNRMKRMLDGLKME